MAASCSPWRPFTSTSNSVAAMKSKTSILEKMSLIILAISSIIYNADAHSGPIPGYVPPPLYEEDATKAPITMTYDYIVIGGGATGCTLAATLSSKKRVLLLERGGAQEEYPGTNNVAGYGDSAAGPTAERIRTVDGAWVVRGVVLGGGTAVNAGILADAEDWFLEALGLDLKEVANAYEDYPHRLGTFTSSTNTHVSGPWLRALEETGFAPFLNQTFEHKVGIRNGAVAFDSTGTRHTAAEFVRQAGLQLKVYLRATVRRIFILNGAVKKCTGVRFTDSRGRNHTAYGKVILSAGVIGSTQLLMLNGIGPSNQLRHLSINPILDLPVGEGVLDEPAWQGLMPSPIPVPNVWLDQHRFHGINAYSHIVIGGGSPQISGSIGIGQLSILPPKARSKWRHGLILWLLRLCDRVIPNFFDRLNRGIAGFATMYQPVSRGYLNLTSTSVEEPPSILINYLRDPADQERAINVIEYLRQVLHNPSLMAKFRSKSLCWVWRLAGLGGGQVLMAILPSLLGGKVPCAFDGVIPPFPTERTKKASLEFARNTYVTGYHLFGGNLKGHVVDDGFRVKGVENLWVADASVFPDSPGTNPMSTCMMFGRYMGLKLLEES